jgi:hypothetical protein
LRAGGLSKTCGTLTGRKLGGKKEAEIELKRTTVAVIAEQHFLTPIILVAYFARKLRQKIVRWFKTPDTDEDQEYIPPMSPHHRPSWTLQLLSDLQPSYYLLKQKDRGKI